MNFILFLLRGLTSFLLDVGILVTDIADFICTAGASLAVIVFTIGSCFWVYSVSPWGPTDTGARAELVSALLYLMGAIVVCAIGHAINKGLAQAFENMQFNMEQAEYSRWSKELGKQLAEARQSLADSENVLDAQVTDITNQTETRSISHVGH